MDEIILKALNGRANKLGFKESDADTKELEMGIKVEMEHTDDTEIAKKIALDHLSELPNYYTLLNEMEKIGKKLLNTKEHLKENNQVFLRKVNYVVNRYPQADEKHLLKMLTILINNNQAEEKIESLQIIIKRLLKHNIEQLTTSNMGALIKTKLGTKRKKLGKKK